MADFEAAHVIGVVDMTSPAHLSSSTPRSSRKCNKGVENKLTPLTLNLPAPSAIHRLDDATMELFRKFDADGDGKISPAELRCGVAAFIGEEVMSPEDAIVAVMLADSDGDGMLGLENLVKLLEEEEGEEEKELNLMEAFRVYEMEGEGCITPISLRRALGRLGESEWSTEDCQVMIKRFDINGDGVISFDEFKIMMMLAAPAHL